MRNDAEILEEARLKGIHSIEDYNMMHERHRIFPAVFEERDHREIIDLSAGVGVVGKRVQDLYCDMKNGARILCNDQSPTCLKILGDLELDSTSFDLDDPDKPYPVRSGSIDAVICLSTIEHLMNIDFCVMEIRRILADDGCLYLSAPNYSGLTYLLPFLLTGKTFHDPLTTESRYEFYAHVRYFTYRTLCEFTCSHGFSLDSVYIGMPKDSTRFKKLDSKSHLMAVTYKSMLKLLYEISSPRWASEPVLCFRKSNGSTEQKKPRKVIL